MSFKVNFNNLISNFEELDITGYTIKSLLRLGYKKMTSIQKISLPPGLAGFDIIGSARTGSGKTLCFVIPIIEISLIQNEIKKNLIKSCITCPTRELGLQFFDFIKNFIKNYKHNLMFMIGGIKLVQKKNPSIIISTPNSLFRCLCDNVLSLSHLKILAIDEADEILNTSFLKILDLLLTFMSHQKQTLLFSATLNSKVKNITRLNLKNPIYCSLLKKSISIVNNIYIYQNNFIKQFIIIIQDHEKNFYLTIFLKSHEMQKIIIFVSTKNQIKFLSKFLKFFYSKFKIFCIYSSINQTNRLNRFIEFNTHTKGVLFSTDLVSRGLDFKHIDWIVQLDCPQNIEYYIHRIGRAGRFLDSGKSILFLNYNEIVFLKILDKNFIKVHVIRFGKKQLKIFKKKTKILFKKNINYIKFAQNAFLSYAKFLYFKKHKKTFKFKNFNWKKISQNFGINYIKLKN